jgi:hypothetical protein
MDLLQYQISQKARNHFGKERRKIRYSRNAIFQKGNLLESVLLLGYLHHDEQ